MKWAIATGFTMKSGQNWLKIFRHHQLLLRRYQPARASPRGGKIAGDLWWLTKFKGIFWALFGALKMVYHIYHVFHGWNCELLNATQLLCSDLMGKKRWISSGIRQPFWRLKNRSAMINPWQNLGDLVRFSASKPETPLPSWHAAH